MIYDDVTDRSTISTHDQVGRLVPARPRSASKRVFVAGRAPPKDVDCPELRVWMHKQALSRYGVERAWWHDDVLYVERIGQIISSTGQVRALQHALTEVYAIESEDPSSVS